jgi:hypothetical protein
MYQDSLLGNCKKTKWLLNYPKTNSLYIIFEVRRIFHYVIIVMRSGNTVCYGGDG